MLVIERESVERERERERGLPGRVYYWRECCGGKSERVSERWS